MKDRATVALAVVLGGVDPRTGLSIAAVADGVLLDLLGYLRGRAAAGS
jgi:hypothetical protein